MPPSRSPFAESIRIEDRHIGPGEDAYVVAEIGSNHDGSLGQAKTLIREAAKAGAEAVKFQTLSYEHLFHEPTTDSDVRELYDDIEVPESWYPELQACAHENDVAFFSSPTYPDAVKLLADLDVPAFKVASAQVVSDVPLIERIASVGKPMIISTGLGGYAHIERALRACLEAGNRDVAVLHCVSEYPTEPERTQLFRIRRLGSAFGTIVGFSDHTMSATIPSAAVALGADIVEKHLTLDRNLEGPDHDSALEVDEFTEMVERIREVEAALGDRIKLANSEEEGWLREHVQLKAVADERLPADERLDPQRVRYRRSPEGISRTVFEELVNGGVMPVEPIEEGTLLRWDHVSTTDDAS